MPPEPPKPALFVVNRERTALDALVADLRRRFGASFAVPGEDSGTAALVTLEAMT